MGDIITLYSRLGAICGTFFSGTTQCGDTGDGYQLPQTVVWVDDSTGKSSGGFSTGLSPSINYREADHLLADGSSIDGKQVAAREISLYGSVLSPDKNTQLQTLRAIVQRLYTDGQRWRYQPGFSMGIGRLKKPQIAYREGAGKVLADVDFQIRANDPYWYDDAWQQVVMQLLGDTTFTVNVDPTIYPDVRPVLQIVSPATSSLPTVRLTNTSDNGRFLEYSDPELGGGAIATIDCRANPSSVSITRAQMTLTGALQINGTVAFYLGYPLRLLPGPNVLTYAGAACTLYISWQGRRF